MAKATVKFVPPVIHDNETGWGPTGIPEQFKDMPYQPYAKSDRLGKVSSVSLLLRFLIICIVFERFYCFHIVMLV